MKGAVLACCLLVFAGGVSASEWTGAVSADWHAAGNWTPAGVPGSDDDVLIPVGLSRYPVVSTAAMCKSLVIQGGSLTTAGSPTLTVHNTAVINPAGTLGLGAASLWVGGDFTVEGIFEGGTGTLTLAKKLVNVGTFNPGTGTVVLTGTFQDIDGHPITFYDLVIKADTYGKVDITVLNDLEVESGVELLMGDDTLTVEGQITGGGSASSQAPFLLSLAVLDADLVELRFSEPVGAGSAGNAANYALDNGGSVLSASVDPSDAAVVRLSVGTLVHALEYVLTMNDILDLSGTPIAGDSRRRFTADYALSHTITATATAGGSVTPAGAVSVAHGADQAFVVTPSAGYFIADVHVDSVSVGPTGGYTFTNVTADHSLTALFSLNTAPGAPAQLEPSDGTAVPQGSLGALRFRWSGSVDPDPGHSVTYTLTVSDTAAVFAQSGIADTTVTIDLSALLAAGTAYTWTVEATDGIAATPAAGPFGLTVDPGTSVGGTSGPLPDRYALGQNYPNPFNPATSIAFDLPERSTVSLRVYNILGVETDVPIDHAVLEPGRHRLTIEFSDRPTGVYLYRLSARAEGGRLFEATGKMTLVR